MVRWDESDASVALSARVKVVEKVHVRASMVYSWYDYEAEMMILSFPLSCRLPPALDAPTHWTRTSRRQ